MRSRVTSNQRCTMMLLIACFMFFYQGRSLYANGQALPSVKLYSAALILKDEVAPDSLAVAIADIGPVSISRTQAQPDANGNYLKDKLAGFQVLVAGKVVPIYAVEDSAHTENKLQVYVYLPPPTPLGSGLLYEGVPVEVRLDDAQGTGQVIANGATKILPTSPNLFVWQGARNEPLVSFNGATGMAGRVISVEGTEDPFSVAGTPNIFSASQETRVVFFGTGFRNAPDTDSSNNPAGFKNVAESYNCLVQYERYIDGDPNKFVGFWTTYLPIEYVGPVAGGKMPGIDQIIIRLTPELKDCVLNLSDGPRGTVRPTLIDIVNKKGTDIPGDPNPRTRIFVK